MAATSGGGPDVVVGYPSAFPNSGGIIGTVPQPAAYATAASTILQFGIPDSVVLAPIHPPPPKKRKTNDEFTILERLEILSELKQTGPNAISVPALAAKHRTSRTSIYRWKKDLPRLLKLSKKSDDTKHKKRVPIKKTKGNRKSTYNEEFSASQKLMAIRELSTSSSSASGGNGVGIDGGSAPAPPSVRAVAAKIGANYRSLYRWKKDEQKLIQLVEQEGKGNCKRLVRDPMGRVKSALKLFYESQQQQQQHQRASDDGNVNGVPPLTGTLLALKGKQIRDEMLAQHEITPFLSEMELKGMREFTGSASWGRKVLHTLVAKEDDDDDGAMTGGMFNEQQQHHPQQQQPPLWDAAPSQPTNATSKSNRKKASLPTQQQQQKIRDLKREITLLKKNLQGCEVRVHELENENAALRAQVASMMNGDDGDGAFEQEEDDEERGGEDEDVEEEGGEDDGYTEYY